MVKEIFASLNNLNIDVGENSINISVSIGVSTVSKRDLEPDDFYNRVDRNLYHSKENGRIQITAK
ncbi:diguanylate cyclase domain-containing protein [Companilactobacillus nuruki]